ncbi:MAG: hypothetical protein U5R06_09665 [candidate division KSB1 bacterium]|nr:hypothetical protein [candidate division KSB1 bacterium]
MTFSFRVELEWLDDSILYRVGEYGLFLQILGYGLIRFRSCVAIEYIQGPGKASGAE